LRGMDKFAINTATTWPHVSEPAFTESLARRSGTSSPRRIGPVSKWWMPTLFPNSETLLSEYNGMRAQMAPQPFLT